MWSWRSWRRWEAEEIKGSQTCVSAGIEDVGREGVGVAVCDGDDMTRSGRELRSSIGLDGDHARCADIIPGRSNNANGFMSMVGDRDVMMRISYSLISEMKVQVW